MVFNLSIAVQKLRAFHYCGLSIPPDDPEVLVINCWVELSYSLDPHPRHFQEYWCGIFYEPV